MPALYVIRHAQPEITGLLTGQSDPALNVYGYQQASLLKGLPGVVYSSPLRRALQTALHIDPRPVILAGLAEITYGDWDGLSWAEIEGRWPEIARGKLACWQKVTPPGGESWSEFALRVTAALKVVLDGPLPAVIVAHEAVNANIAAQFGNERIEEYRQKYCEIKEYDIRAPSEPGRSCAPAPGIPDQAGRKPGAT
jgi:broad specificity phosphatase PhoE